MNFEYVLIKKKKEKEKEMKYLNEQVELFKRSFEFDERMEDLKRWRRKLRKNWMEEEDDEKGEDEKKMKKKKKENEFLNRKKGKKRERKNRKV